MARGSGFTCDQCAAEAVASGDAPPQGWVVLLEREVNPFGEDFPKARAEFCSDTCLATFAVGRVADELEASA